MHPSYSPLFTWGLLAERCMGSSSRSPVEESPSRSAPPPPPPSSQLTSNDDGSVFYFTLQPSKRDTVEFNSSFLYLDLADHRSTKTTHRRKPSTLSKSTSWTCTANVNSTNDLSRKEKETPMNLKPMSSSTLPRNTHRRSSKESLRNLPSPKPAPSSTLPELPSITSQSPSSVLSSPATSTFPSHKASHSAPTISSAMLSPSRASNPSSLRSASISSHDRRKSRMDALACLEGRSRAPNRITRSKLRNNFMDLSDDEGENVTRTSKSNPPCVSEHTPPQILIEDLSSFADVEDEADAISPTLSRKRVSSSQSKSPRPQMRLPGRKRRSTIEGWFPLKSFIDFNKDDDTSSWNWRSFIEIGGVA